jgi:phospholipid-translocating ATPase
MVNLKRLSSNAPSLSASSSTLSNVHNHASKNRKNAVPASMPEREPLMSTNTTTTTLSHSPRLGKENDPQVDLESGESSLTDSPGRNGGRRRRHQSRRRPWYQRWRERLFPPRRDEGRTIWVGFHPDLVDHQDDQKALMVIKREKGRTYAPNVVRNQKYRSWSFVFVVLYNQFRYFFNLYFLIVCITQFFPIFRVTYVLTNVIPLALVLSITLLKEAYDDYHRYLRDCEANGQLYGKLLADGSVTMIPSGCLKVGDVVVLHKDQRVPADVVLLKTSVHDSGSQGAVFIRTDQLDGEIDWKLRVAAPATQRTVRDADLFRMRLQIYAGPPSKDILFFIGTLSYNTSLDDITVDHHRDDARRDERRVVVPLNVENTLWMNAVLASTGPVYGLVVYTGADTRAVMNTCPPRTKDGLTDRELNTRSKALCLILVILSVLMVSMHGWQPLWLVYFVRFVVLFSTIIPLSLRVNLDLCKSVCSGQIGQDREHLPGAIVRTSTLPEELGRVNYVLTDKTGTLTMNDMTIRTVHLGTVALGVEDIAECRQYIHSVLCLSLNSSPNLNSNPNPSSNLNPNSTTLNMSAMWGRRDLEHRVFAFAVALALCHNVTPVYDTDGEYGGAASREGREGMTYQASSPDEIAIVKWTESVGVRLLHRDRESIVLRLSSLRNPLASSSMSSSSSDVNSPSHPPANQNASNAMMDSDVDLTFDIEHLFPFSSDLKRMGIIVRERTSGERVFYLKGADTVMQGIVQRTGADWMPEESTKLAQQGLRTLVVARKRLSPETYDVFAGRYQEAGTSVTDRPGAMRRIIADLLEQDMELLGVTGVEDRLQDQVKHTLERLRSASVKVWMLTGDKVETAKCIAVSTGLFDAGGCQVIEIVGLTTYEEAEARLDQLLLLLHGDNASGQQPLRFMTLPNHQMRKVLVIDGRSLQLYLEDGQLATPFFDAACRLPAVICCRCSPTQKADVARQIQRCTKSRVCCIGDGGNDVSMIQAADVGIGIVGKEGRQASLAADISLSQFKHLAPLLLWHGRLSYKRTASVSQFVIHRGFIIAIMQAVFSAVLYFSPIALYQGMLSIGYTTVYTMAPVFSLVLDLDISLTVAMTYPELYAELLKGRELNWKVFFKWLAVSTYQGGVLMILALWLFEREFIHIVSITFTALILNELLMVALHVHRWHWLMILAELSSIIVYVVSVRLLPDEFDLNFVHSWSFVGKVVAMTLASFLPMLVYQLVRRCVAPPSYAKLESSSNLLLNHRP